MTPLERLEQRHLDLGAPVELGIVDCTRSSERALEVRGARVPGFRRWLDRGALHDRSHVFAAGDRGLLVVTAEWARAEGVGGDVSGH